VTGPGNAPVAVTATVSRLAASDIGYAVCHVRWRELLSAERGGGE